MQQVERYNRQYVTLASRRPAAGSDIPADPAVRSDYCTVLEAAAELGVSRVTVWRWIRTGHLPAIRPGRRTIRIRRADLEALQAPLGPVTGTVPGAVDLIEATPGHERQLAALVERSPDVIFRLDRDLRHLYVNSAIERETGRPASAYLGRTGREMGLPAAVSDRFELACRELFATGAAAAVEFTIGDQSYRSRLIPELAADGTVGSLMGITENVSDRRLLEQVQQDFIATASHDLKSPLTAIIGFAQYVTRALQVPSPDLAAVARGTATIVTQAWAMARLIDDLLDASRVQLDALQLRTAPSDLGSHLATVLARLTPDERRRVEVVLPAAPLAGDWDGPRVEQVLANLIGNALKYSPADRPVEVSVERGAGEIVVAVSDRGLGIAADELPRLFQRFYRTAGARESGLSGTGLGLYICAGIVAAHGGRLWAESAGEGQGSTFRFLLPDEPPPGSDEWRT